MNKETRIEKISQILSQKPIWSKQLMWQWELKTFEVYNVPLNCLIYNKYNWRILSRTKSLEKQWWEIKSDTDEWKKLIEGLLWKSKEDRNQKTLKDLENFWQKEYWIITKDWIIIDGNRRAMLLNKIPKYLYFKTVILDITLEENPLEIQKLETSYQMWEDEKLWYNPIEKYLKSKDLLKQWVTIEQIADWMWETRATIEQYLAVMNTMDDYLDYLWYNWIYTQLDGREDQFISLTWWLNNFYNNQSAKWFDWYTNNDVDDLKTISFDYIRAKYEWKSFRNIANWQKQNHFFWNKEIWESFRDTHFDKIIPIQDSEDKINFDSLDLKSTLDDRDDKYILNSYDLLKENLEYHNSKLWNQQHKDEPIKLVNKAIDAISVAKINKNSKSDEVIEKIEILDSMIESMMLSKSPKSILKKVMELLSSLDLNKVWEEIKAEILFYTKDIQKIAYQIEKDLK